MAPPARLSEPRIQSLARLLQEIIEGDLRLPLLRRDFVWTNHQRLELFDSVRDGIPMGSLLIWRTATWRLECFQGIGPCRLPERPVLEGRFSNYLLDGVQRLTTLLGSLHPWTDGPPVPSDKALGEGLNWDLYYDLEARTFRIHEGEEDPPPTWQPLFLTFDSMGLIRFQRALASQPEADRLIHASDELVSAFRDYKVPVLSLVTENLEQATRVFRRINSQGAPLSEFHLRQALTWGRRSRS